MGRAWVWIWGVSWCRRSEWDGDMSCSSAWFALLDSLRMYHDCTCFMMSGGDTCFLLRVVRWNNSKRAEAVGLYALDIRRGFLLSAIPGWGEFFAIDGWHGFTASVFHF
jgi:hypothetical protein